MRRGAPGEASVPAWTSGALLSLTSDPAFLSAFSADEQDVAAMIPATAIKEKIRFILNKCLVTIKKLYCIKTDETRKWLTHDMLK